MADPRPSAARGGARRRCTARHLFCAVRGIKPFYVPRSHLVGLGVNARCLDPGTVRELIVRSFDGQNGERSYPAGRGEFER